MAGKRMDLVVEGEERFCGSEAVGVLVAMRRSQREGRDSTRKI
jgi:hypothetical protein